MTHARLAICEHCDAVYQKQALHQGQTAHCQRCGARLYRATRIDLDVMTALAAGGVIMLLIANLFPIITVEVQGTERMGTLWGAVLMTYDTGMGAVAVLAALTAFFFPLLTLLLHLHVLLPLRAGLTPAGLVPSLHALRILQPWSMVEVFVLGVLVAAVKLAGMASVRPGPGLWAFAALTVLLIWLNTHDLHQLWDRATEKRE